MVNVSCIYRIKCQDGSDAENVMKILSKNDFLSHDNFSFRTVSDGSGVDSTIFKITLHGKDSVYKLVREISDMDKPTEVVNQPEGIWKKIFNYFMKSFSSRSE